MPYKFRSLAASLALLALAASPAHAIQLSLNFSGVTLGSTGPDSTPIADGTAFDLHAVFEDGAVMSQPGIGVYQVDAMNFTVGTMSYSVPQLNLGNYAVFLTDPSLPVFGPVYLAGLVSPGNDAFAPVYLTAGPALSGAAAAPTVYSTYLGSLGNQIAFSTAKGNVTLAYDTELGVSGSITAVPEPSSSALFLGGAAALLFLFRRRAAPSA